MSVQYVLNLKTYLIDHGHVVTDDGCIVDPFDSSNQVTVRDAKSFGYEPVVDNISGDRTVEDYVNHWFPEDEWERDENAAYYLDFTVDLFSLTKLARQSDCHLNGDELGRINPVVLAAAEKEDERLGAVLRLNQRFAFVLNPSNDSVYDQLSGALISMGAFERLIASDVWLPSGSDTPIRNSRIWLGHAARRTYYGASFYPLGRDSDGHAADGTKLNLWRGFPERFHVGTQGDASVIQRHVEEVFHQGNAETCAWENNYWAHLIQKPWEKPHANIVRCEREGGSGKDIFAKMLREKVVGADNSTELTGIKALTSNFNAHLAMALLVVGNEIAWAGDHDSRNILWGETGSSTRSLERKGVDRITIPNYSRYLIHSNNERPVAATIGDRRFGVFETLHWSSKFPDGIGSEAYTAYFREFAAACASRANVSAYIGYLLGLNLDNFNPFMAPSTDAKNELMEANFAPREAWLYGVAKAGGFRDADNVFHPIANDGNGAWVPASVVIQSAAKAFLKVSPNSSLDVSVGMYLGQQPRKKQGKLAEKDYIHRDDVGRSDKEAHYNFGSLDQFRIAAAIRLGISPERLLD